MDYYTPEKISADNDYEIAPDDRSTKNDDIDTEHTSEKTLNESIIIDDDVSIAKGLSVNSEVSGAACTTNLMSREARIN